MLIISSILGFGIGWAKPTPVNPYNLRYGRRGESLVALCRPALEPGHRRRYRDPAAPHRQQR